MQITWYAKGVMKKVKNVIGNSKRETPFEFKTLSVNIFFIPTNTNRMSHHFLYCRLIWLKPSQLAHPVPDGLLSAVTTNTNQLTKALIILVNILLKIFHNCSIATFERLCGLNSEQYKPWASRNDVFYKLFVRGIAIMRW